MPVSAKLFKVKLYPKEFPVNTVPTATRFGDNFELMTKVDHLGKGEYKEKDLEKLMIIHDKGSKFEGIGYSKENGRIEDILSIAEEKEFPAFVFPEKDYLFAAYSSKDVFNQAFKRLSQHNNTFEEAEGKKLDAQKIIIDLTKLKESYADEDFSPSVMGGWFRDLKITNVDVAYLGGGGVVESDDWFKYESSGEISALRLDFPNPDIDEEPFRLLLTRDGSLFSFKNFSENEFLKIVVPIFEYIKKFVK